MEQWFRHIWNDFPTWKVVPVHLPVVPSEKMEQWFHRQKTDVTVDESVREEDRSDDEEKDEDKKDVVCQLLNQRTASQRRDKSCAPSH